MQFGPGFASTFLYYFVSTALVTTFIASKGMGISPSTGLPQQLGLLVGLFAGLLGGYFNRTVSFSVAFSDRPTFLKSLNESLEAMGYHQIQEDEDGVIVYERSPLRKLFSGRVFVKLEDSEALIASRSIHTMALRKRLE